MRVSSRQALEEAAQECLALLRCGDVTIPTSMQVGSDLFDVVAVLDEDRRLRSVLADSSYPADNRVGLARELFGSRVSSTSMEVLEKALRFDWANSADLRDGLVELGQRSVIFAAMEEGQHEHVESELFQFARLLEREGELTQLLGDKSQSTERRRELCATVLYGKVRAVTEALILQAISRPVRNPIDDVDRLAQLVARVRGKTIARVSSAVSLNEDQRLALANKLGTIYGTDVSIHSEVVPGLLGGVVVRVGDEIIDGSIAGKLEKMRRAFA